MTSTTKLRAALGKQFLSLAALSATAKEQPGDLVFLTDAMLRLVGELRQLKDAPDDVMFPECRALYSQEITEALEKQMALLIECPRNCDCSAADAVNITDCCLRLAKFLAPIYSYLDVRAN